MASLPRFHAFHQAAPDKQVGGSSGVPSLRSAQQAEDPVVSAIRDAGHGSPGNMPVHLTQSTQPAMDGICTGTDGSGLHAPFTRAVQLIQGTQVPVYGILNGARGSDTSTPAPVTRQFQKHVQNASDLARGDDLDHSETQAYQRPTTQVKSAVNDTRGMIEDLALGTSPVQATQAPEVSVRKNAVDGNGHGPRTFPSEVSELSSAGGSSAFFNSTDPATSEVLEPFFSPKGIDWDIAKLGSDPHTGLELPVVSVNITASITFVTMRIASFMWPSAMPPAALAFILNLVLIYPKPGGLSGAAAVWVSTLAALAALASMLFLLTSSVYTIIKDKKAKFERQTLHDLSKVAAASYLFVLGSGGHTTEMSALIKLSQKPYRHTHRRYLITAGDNHSRNQASLLEEKMIQSHADASAGTSDMVIVTRARSVHQSYITSVFTSLKCFFEIANALIDIPSARVGQPGAEDFRSPHVIVTNGPGTGFIVGLVALFLKVFHVVPHDRLKVVFVETWARTHSLGLTGKLFYVTQIADLFVVQSEDLAKAINKPCIGNVNKKWADLVNAAHVGGHDAPQGAGQRGQGSDEAQTRNAFS